MFIIIYKILQESKLRGNLPEPVFVKHENVAEVELPHIELGTDIPKVIYRTWKTNDVTKFQKSISRTQKTNPGYTQIVYSDTQIEEFIKKEYSPRILNAYRSIRDEYGPAKADLFRYLILYKHGGIYLDIKTAAVKKIEPYKTFVTSKQTDMPFHKSRWSLFPPYGTYNQWVLISPKGHPVLKQLIQTSVLNIEHAKKHPEVYNNGYGVHCITGPIMFSKIVNENLETVKILNSHINGTFVKNYVNHLKILGDEYYMKKNSAICK